MSLDNLKRIIKSINKFVPTIALIGTVLTAYFQFCLDMYNLGYLQVIGVDLCYSSEMNLKGRFALTIIIVVFFLLSCFLSYYLTTIVLLRKEEIKSKVSESSKKRKALIIVVTVLMHIVTFGLVSYLFLLVVLSLLLPFNLGEIMWALLSEEKSFIFLFAVVFFGAVLVVWPNTNTAESKGNNRDVTGANHRWHRIAAAIIIISIPAIFGVTTCKSLGENLAKDNREYKVIVSELPNDTERKKEGKNQLVLYEGKEVYILSDYREVDDNKGEKKTLQIFNNRQVVVDKKEIETVTKEYDDVILEPDDNPHSESGEIDRN